jgi:hypothetical protein
MPPLAQLHLRCQGAFISQTCRQGPARRQSGGCNERSLMKLRCLDLVGQEAMLLGRAQLYPTLMPKGAMAWATRPAQECATIAGLPAL